ncbi:MAG TPA: hypothetical protein VFA10_14215 [Ktedonobacteraceae bacterium]|nr:hypothetical protein [Ktedonobacteraceae bacterium]
MMKTTTIAKLLHVKQVIAAIKAIERDTLTERERCVIEECLDQAYDRAATLLAELDETHPGLMVPCLLVSVALTILYEKCL